MTGQPKDFLPYGRHYVDADDIKAVVDVLKHGQLTQGPKIEEFEKALAAYVGSKYAVAVSSGTAALHLACLAAGLGKGDIVVTSSNTFVASANCARYVGATPKCCDIDSDTLNLDPRELQKAYLKYRKIKAVIPVHFAGLPCEMAEIRRLAMKHKSIVIEDAAHALGSVYKNGKKVGSCVYAEMTTFSFHPVKLIAAGEGGAITTNNPELYEQLLMLRSHGITKNPLRMKNRREAFTDGKLNPWYYEMQDLGFNYRMTDIQAALAISQLKKIELFLLKRKEIVKRYDQAFDGQENFILPQRNGRELSAHHIYVVRINFKSLKTSRSKFMNSLKKANVGTQVHYIPVPMHPAYRRYREGDHSFPNTERYYEQALSLPIYHTLSIDNQARVIENVLRLIS